MKKILILAVLVFLLSGCTLVNKKYFEPEFTFLITIDGARADYVKQLNPPTIKYLVENNNTKYSFNSDTVCPSITTSAHASLFTGVEPKIHNFYEPGNDINSKTIFEVFEENGYKTLLLDGKGGRIKGLEKSVSYYMGNKNYYDYKEINSEIMKDFLDMFEKNRPTFSFILLPESDIAGHEYGHTSIEYSQAIIKTDKTIGLLVNYLKEKNILKKSNIVIVADHGMTDKNHDACLVTDVKIPIIKYGKGFKKTLSSDQNIKDIAKEILNIYNLNFK